MFAVDLDYLTGCHITVRSTNCSLIGPGQRRDYSMRQLEPLYGLVGPLRRSFGSCGGQLHIEVELDDGGFLDVVLSRTTRPA